MVTVLPQPALRVSPKTMLPLKQVRGILAGSLKTSGSENGELTMRRNSSMTCYQLLARGSLNDSPVVGCARTGADHHHPGH